MIADRASAGAALDHLTFCANNASLVLAHAGDRAGARAVCDAQIAWVARAGEQNPDLRIYAVQPWLNLGRLRLLEGDRAGALEHFTAIDPRPALVRFGELEVPDGAWERARVTRAHRCAMFAVDTLRTLLGGGEVAAARAFVEELADHASGVALDVLADARLAALMLGGETSAAVALAVALAKDDPSVRGAAFATRLVEALLLADDREQASLACDALAGRLARLASEAPADLFLGFLFGRGAELARLLGRDDLARRLGLAALSTARAIGDEVLAIESSDGLVRAHPDDASYAAARHALRANTAYRRFRESTATLPVLERLRRAILDALA